MCDDHWEHRTPCRWWRAPGLECWLAAFPAACLGAWWRAPGLECWLAAFPAACLGADHSVCVSIYFPALHSCLTPFHAIHTNGCPFSTWKLQETDSSSLPKAVFHFWAPVSPWKIFLWNSKAPEAWRCSKLHFVVKLPPTPPRKARICR